MALYLRDLTHIAQHDLSHGDATERDLSFVEKEVHVGVSLLRDEQFSYISSLFGSSTLFSAPPFPFTQCMVIVKASYGTYNKLQ